MKRRNRIAWQRGVSRAFVLGPMVFLLVAGAGCPSLFESPTQRATHIRQAVVGRDGAYTVPAANTVVNVYAPLIADAAVGAKTISVTDATFLSAVSQGDLLLIVQMAGATIGTADTVTYGAVTDLGSAGRYEFVGVEGKSSNTITLACGLKNGYGSTGKTQVIRVPQYTTLTIGSANSITAPAWNGVTGGVVAVHANVTVQLDGSVNVAGKGFRGGSTVGDNASDVATSLITLYRSPTNTDGAEKGEGIAGYQGEYTNGRYGRGAPANGGGGGDSHNAGGGGGANAPSGAAWTGQGVMEQCALTEAYRAGWQLDDGYISNANTCTNSEGGGRGGYSYSSGDQDPLAVAPGTCTGGTSWAGNCRRQVGGLGGRPVPNNPAFRLFMGGGGGAGDGNNNVAGRGGNGGGLVFIIAGTVAGAGSIIATGEAGGNAVFAAGGGDAPGGGGGGGTVVVHATTLSAFTISVNGGNGGDQVGSSGPTEVEGPGGGGGGGYVAVSGGSPTITAAGGPAGTTDRTVMTTFPTDGATAGNAGVTNGSASTFLYCGAMPVTTIATHPTNPTKDTTSDFTFTNTSNPVTYECKVDTADWALCTASYTSPTLADGSHALSVRATDANANAETPPATFTWVIDTVAPDTTIATKPSNPSNSATGGFTFTSNESPVTFECKVDTGAWASCTASYATPALADGSHTLSVRATDAAGNVDATPDSYTWVINTTLPATTIATHPLDHAKTATGDFTFTNTASPVTYECKLDTGDWASCTASYTTPTLADGSHTLSVRASESVTDAASLVEDPPVTFTWTIDTVAPDTTIATKPSDPSSSAMGTFTFTSNESPVTFECKVDTGAWASCPASFTTTVLADGSHTLSVRATDAAGNVDDSPATYTWMIGAVSVDGGAVDTGAAIDGTPVPTVDAQEVDAEKVDVQEDVQEIDAQGADLAVAQDLALAPDVVKLDIALADRLPDVQLAEPEPGPDTALPLAEPNPDTAGPVVKDDAAAPPVNDDAAPAVDNLKILGGGFCTIAGSRSTSPAPYWIMGLAALALLRRRRKTK
jgi:hypothetical protein